MGREERLLAFARRRAGQTLRAVVVHSGEGVDVRYVRDDLQGETGPPELVDMVRRCRTRRDDAAAAPVASHATLRMYDDAVAIHLPQAGGGVILSLDTTAASAFASFVAECRARLDGTVDEPGEPSRDD